MIEPLPDTTYTIPPLYRESFFAGDSLLHPELTVRPSGLYSQRIVNSFAQEDGVVIAFILMAALLIILFRLGGREIANRNKLLFLIFPSVAFALSAVLVFPDLTAQTTGAHSSYIVWGILSVCLSATMVFRVILYWMINRVFFTWTQCTLWQKIYTKVLFLETVFSVLLLASILYLSVPFQVVLWMSALLLISPKIMLLYHTKQIFFPDFYGTFQIIVYFCALELMPLLICWYIFVRVMGSFV
uniref:DUF4271 domain-containing protein n=1 Tax=uncultured bacterium fosmid pJB135F11 TaxID=1478051 RepID=A0A0H3U8B9_9BACT|nr:hypothetical protein [uncultured bacterium fosmid pJB135F11]